MGEIISLCDLNGSKGKGNTGGVWGPKVCSGGNRGKLEKLGGQDGHLGQRLTPRGVGVGWPWGEHFIRLGMRD